MQQLNWRKSSYSGAAEQSCIEVAASPVGIHVRDSKDPRGPVLTFTNEEMEAFVRSAGNGHFDIPG